MGFCIQLVQNRQRHCLVYLRWISIHPSITNKQIFCNLLKYFWGSLVKVFVMVFPSYEVVTSLILWRFCLKYFQFSGCKNTITLSILIIKSKVVAKQKFEDTVSKAVSCWLTCALQLQFVGGQVLYQIETDGGWRGQGWGGGQARWVCTIVIFYDRSDRLRSKEEVVSF